MECDSVYMRKLLIIHETMILKPSVIHQLYLSRMGFIGMYNEAVNGI